MKKNNSFRKLRKKRKASLQISINAIVILILAMVILGLGLTFVRELFTGATDNIQLVSEQINSFLGYKDFPGAFGVASGPSFEDQQLKEVFVQVRNRGSTTAKYKISINTGDATIKTYYRRSAFYLKSDQIAIFPVYLRIPNESPGYRINFKLTDHTSSTPKDIDSKNIQEI